MRILFYDNGRPFNLDTPYETHLGGSETSLILLAKGLSELGHTVYICNNYATNDSANNKIILRSNLFTMETLQECDLIICNRSFPNGLQNFIGKKRIYYFSHDAYDQHLICDWIYKYDILQILNGFFCVSEWQKNTFFKYFKIPSSLFHKFHIIGNPLDLSLYYGYSERNKNKLIYSSIPYKGLEILPALFDDICIQSKKDDLELHVFSSMKLYYNDDGKSDEKYDDIFSTLRNMKNVFLHDLVSMKRLAYEFSTSNLYIHPNLYHETFGMVLTQCQAAGCLPITTNKGAVNEVIKNNSTGFIVDYPNIENIDCYKIYINKICELLESYDALYKNRLEAQEWAKQFDYLKLAKKMEEVLLET